jgi:RNA polymerase sigma factor (sigma-70 family)
VTPKLDRATERRLRELSPEVLAALMRRYRDFTACEDALQEAFIAAAEHWPNGMPENPKAWLIHVAGRRMTDQIRSEAARRRREAVVISLVPPELQVVLPTEADDLVRHDETLALLFMCCHPAVSQASATALTLRAVGGLTTAEIASAFMVPEATMAQRISRAKDTIKSSGVPFELPSEDERVDRLDTVMHVLYLVFSEGYATSSGKDVVRSDLANEAIRLTRLLSQALPEVAEVSGLLALMLLSDARRDARSGPNGELVPLDQQDRTLWDRAQIREGVALVSAALPRGRVGPYQIQAAIAAVHDEAASADATDWPQILALYGVLSSLADSPMVRLSHAIAAAMVHGPALGLDLLRPLDDDARFKNHHRLAAVRGHLHEKLGDLAQAREHYRLAAGRTTSTPERDYLLAQAARLSEKELREPAKPSTL